MKAIRLFNRWKAHPWKTQPWNLMACMQCTPIPGCAVHGCVFHSYEMMAFKLSRQTDKQEVIMKIYRPRGISRSQLVLITVLGVFSGVYIWRPLFDELFGRKKVAIEPVKES